MIDQLDKSIAAMRYAFSNSNVIVANDPSHDPGIGIFNGNRAIRDKIFILEALRKNGLIEEWTKLVNYISEIGNPREPSQRGGLPTPTGFGLRATAFRDELVRVAQKDLGL